MSRSYLFPLSIQITLPKNYRSNEGFRERLSLLQEFYFSGVKLNIEEVSMPGTLEEHRNYYDNLHVSDNNRLFPGLGGIDFPSLFQYLVKKDYSGGIAIEGDVKSTFEAD